jgi:tetratricopeptide (TPR) repeat protein/TolB-like protein/DNA-binding winged helix-turn-helix (wHTH) protein
LNVELLQDFYLGPLLVEPLKRQVSGRGGAAHLGPRAMEVLLCLAKTPGEVVTREQLLEEVWGADHGSQEALSHAISEIRHALDDHADHPTFIQTLPKRGYRLLLHPELVAETTSSVVLGAERGARVTDIGFLENLKQRGVLETAIGYLLVGWLLIQVSDIVFDQLHLPEWAGTFVTVLVIAGLPIALVLSWFLEFRDGRAVLHELSAADARKQRFSRTYLSIVGALAIATVLVYVYDRSYGLPEAGQPLTQVFEEAAQLPPVVENSFAVLPFVNLDGSKETQVFADGLVDDVITQLSRVPGLRVASRGDSYTLAPNSASQDVRHRLRVAMYLEGSVEMAKDKLRVTVQMINSEDGFHVLSRQFDRPREAFFEVRDEITSITVANVRVQLPPGLRTSSLKVSDDPSLDVYVLYRRGIEASRQPTTIDTVITALGWFDAALNVDPGYAAAHAGKCAVLVLGYTEVDDASFISRAESSCATALALNPNLDVVHTSLGDLYQSTGRYADAKAAYETALAHDPSNVDALTGLGETFQHLNRLADAEASLRTAVDVHPGDAQAYNRLGVFYYQTGRFPEAATAFEYLVALEPNNMRGFSNLASAYMLQGDFARAAPAFQRAIDIEPTKTAYSNLGLMYYYLGDLDAAIESHRHAVELAPNDYLARSNLGDALWVAGRQDEARKEFEKAEKMARDASDVNPNDPFTMMDLAWINAMLDNKQEARTLIDRARELAPDDPYTHYYNGMVYLRAGKRDAALAALDKAVELGYPRSVLAAEPHLAALRNSPRFSALVDAS